MSLHHYEPAFVDNLTTSMRAELQKGLGVPGSPEVYPVLAISLSLPGLEPSTRLYAGVGGGSKTAGVYEGRIESWGTVPRGVSVKGNQLQSLDLQVTLADQPDVIADSFTVLAASFPLHLRRAPVTIRWLSPNVPYQDTAVAFSGVLASCAPISPWRWRLRLTADDNALVGGFFPRHTLSAADFPQIHADALAQIMPVCYGQHSSDGQSTAGMIALPLVDTVAKRYFGTLGVAQAIDVAYRNETRLVATDWTRVDLVVNGKAVTLINVPSATDQDTVSVDMRGLTDRGDGTGELIRNPVRQIRHWLEAFVWGQWSQGAYPTSAPLDYALFARAEAFCEAAGYEGSKYFQGAEPLACKDVLNEWADSNEIKLFWTAAGKLGIAVLDPGAVVLGGTPWILGGEEVAEPAIADDIGGLCTRVDTQYVYGQADSKFYQDLVVEDRSLLDDISVSRQQPWSASRVS